MQQQVVWSINFSNDDNKTDCFSYIVKQCHFYIENVGIVAKKVLSKPWSILTKQSIRKKKKQVNIYKTILFLILIFFGKKNEKGNLELMIIFSHQLFTIPNTSSFYS